MLFVGVVDGLCFFVVFVFVDVSGGRLCVDVMFVCYIVLLATIRISYDW